MSNNDLKDVILVVLDRLTSTFKRLFTFKTMNSKISSLSTVVWEYNTYHYLCVYENFPCFYRQITNIAIKKQNFLMISLSFYEVLTVGNELLVVLVTFHQMGRKLVLESKL